MKMNLEIGEPAWKAIGILDLPPVTVAFREAEPVRDDQLLVEDRLEEAIGMDTRHGSRLAARDNLDLARFRQKGADLEPPPAALVHEVRPQNAERITVVRAD